MSVSILAGELKKKIYTVQFQGFHLSDLSDVTLSGYEYKYQTGQTFSLNSCTKANRIDVSKIADYDYFRFNLLLISCEGLKKYLNAAASNISHFPEKLSVGFIEKLPISIFPQLSKSEFKRNYGKTIDSFYKKTRISKNKNGTFIILTDDDEIYLNVLARGDFNKDGFEDLLIETQWYAQKAYGKYADLIIISQKNKGSAAEIIWRLNT